MDTFKFTDLIKGIMFVKYYRRTSSNRRCVYLVWPLGYLTRKPPAPAKRATLIFTEVISCNSLLIMGLVRVHRYPKLVPRYKFFILDTYHPRTIYNYVSKDVRIRRYFSKPKGVREQKMFGKHCPRGIFTPTPAAKNSYLT